MNLIGSKKLHEEYRSAQRAMADLKAAVFAVLESRANKGMSNAEIGRTLGIYAGHKGHEGHISRTLLSMLEAEGIVEQDESTKIWKIIQRANDEN